MSATTRFWIVFVLLAVSAIAFYRLPDGQETRPVAPLRTVPQEFLGWHAIETPLEERLVKATGVDDYVNRLYIHEALPVVSLYVGFYRSQRTGDTVHSPKNCLPGAGWQPVRSGTILLRTPDGRGVLANLYEVERDVDRQIVLYWYQSHGRVVASEYAAKVYLVLDAIRLNRTDGALVRVTTPLEPSSEQAQRRAVAFAEELLPLLNDILPQ